MMEQIVVERAAEEASIVLSEDEQALQNDVSELTWPAETDPRYRQLRDDIVEIVKEWMRHTGTGQRRTAAIIGWPHGTLVARLARFPWSGPNPGEPRKQGRDNTQLAKAVRRAEADPDAFVASLSPIARDRVRAAAVAADLPKSDLDRFAVLCLKAVKAESMLYEVVEFLEADGLTEKQQAAVSEMIRNVEEILQRMREAHDG